MNPFKISNIIEDIRNSEDPKNVEKMFDLLGQVKKCLNPLRQVKKCNTSIHIKCLQKCL